ncbi:hypothetical protein GGQ86_004028 [Xanthobacter flavus]|uniref:Uncharacterized protein n=1 Tax=Xanthobacter flavus TaxID=281 RepID=A0A9W6CQV4_XANFL|nr:hypothetical protein [Xanthobacter flavus]GLI24790.1 hypothetical protein XFLAVUS301_44640 [Xanthobacter flavus]
MKYDKEIDGELVVSSGDTEEVLQFGEEGLERIALAVEPLAEAGISLPIGFGRDI